MDPTCVRRAFLWACALDVQARKPGNVSWASPGHRMQAQQFIASAQAAVGPVCLVGRPVGQRIEAAMQATWAAAGCNTNLGIVLLCAPLAAACERVGDGVDAAGLRAALQQVLEALDVDDTRAAYRAIALTKPGGLGQADAQDVMQPPSVALRAAMALAAHRDRIAHQYLHGHVDIFETGLPAFAAALRLGTHSSPTRALQRVFLELLAAFPDSHIVRKHGAAVAQIVMSEALPWREQARTGVDLDADKAYEAWDESLKQRLLNPGTSADLCVATAMAAALLDTRLSAEG